MDIECINSVLTRAILGFQESEIEVMSEAMAYGVTGGYEVPAPGAFAVKKEKKVPVTMSVVWRGSPPPKKEPMWITDLNKKQRKTHLHKIEKTSMLTTTQLRQMEGKSDILMKSAMAQMERDARGGPAYLIRVTMSAEVPREIHKAIVPRSKNSIVLLFWDAWSKRWEQSSQWGGLLYRFIDALEEPRGY